MASLVSGSRSLFSLRDFTGDRSGERADLANRKGRSFGRDGRIRLSGEHREDTPTSSFRARCDVKLGMHSGDATIIPVGTAADFAFHVEDPRTRTRPIEKGRREVKGAAV